MSKSVQRLGDRNEQDGEIVSTVQNTVFANSLTVSVDGSSVESVDETANGSATVYVENRPVNREGDLDLISNIPRRNGSPDVFVGD